MRKATLKASVSALAPKVEAISSSRAKPVMRESRVNTDTTEADLRRLTAGSVAASCVHNRVGAQASP